MFVFQTILSNLELKEDSNIEYTVASKLKGLFKGTLAAETIFGN